MDKPHRQHAEKVTPELFTAMKQRGEKICAIVTYSYTMARLADEAGVDAILVGDSVARVVSGLPDYSSVDIDQMVYHTQAVSRACRHACVLADLPQRSIVGGVQASSKDAFALVAEAGAAMVKVEGYSSSTLESIHAIAQNGIPVMGHFGMPSAAHDAIHDHKRRANEGIWTEAIESELMDRAQRLIAAGCCALLLSKISSKIAQSITERFQVPTVGIGSGPFCDGQILVFEDLLALTEREPPYYVKEYAHLDEEAIGALKAFINDVRNKAFPGLEHYRPG